MSGEGLEGERGNSQAKSRLRSFFFSPLQNRIHFTSAFTQQLLQRSHQRGVTTRSSCHWLLLKQPALHSGSRGPAKPSVLLTDVHSCAEQPSQPTEGSEPFLASASPGPEDEQGRCTAQSPLQHTSPSQECFTRISKILICSASLYLPELLTFTFSPFHTKVSIQKKPDGFL